MPQRPELEQLRAARATIEAGGGAQRIAKQHAAGKYTARERISTLCDPDTFQELFPFARHRCTNFGMADQSLPAEGVVTGCGLVQGRQVYIASQDFTVAGGSVGEMHADKICRIMDEALHTGSPVICINDSGGARIQEGIDALSGYGRIFYRNVLLSGVVPQIAIVAGPCAGGAAYSPALMDFIIMLRGTGELFITGPQVIRQVTGEQISAQELGGALAQMQSGVVHFIADNDAEALAICQRLLSFLPANNMQDPPDYGDGTLAFADDAGLISQLPLSPREPYDVRTIITRIVDNGDLLEIQPHFAANAVIGLARMNGRSIGVVANQPSVLGGALDVDASDKIAGFVRFCNAFNIPLLTLVDVPGFLPGVAQERSGIIRHGSKMLFAYATATVPKVTLILRKAYGGAYLAMCSRDMGADRVLAWPTAEVAVMGPEGAVNIVYRDAIKAADDPQAAREQFIAEYRGQFANPYAGAARNLIDDVIDPKDTRRAVGLAFASLRTKRQTRPQKKHGLIAM
jgi:methylmalonyl-CoA carboxyltransferase large subunit